MCNHGREVCRAWGHVLPPPVFLKIGKIYRLPPPRFWSWLLNWLLTLGSNSGGTIKNYQPCTVYSLYLYSILYQYTRHCCIRTSCTCSSGSRILVRGGEKAQTEFHTWIPLKSCTAMASPKFRFGGTEIRQKFTNKRLLKNLLKNLHKNLKNLQHFSKIKFNRI